MQDLLTSADKRGLALLLLSHILPYGEVKLHITSRLALERSCIADFGQRALTGLLLGWATVPHDQRNLLGRVGSQQSYAIAQMEKTLVRVHARLPMRGSW